MSEVFADSGYWIALANPSDENHESARRLARNARGREIVTTEMVLVEVFAYMSKRGERARRRAVELLENIKNDEDIEVVHQTHEQFEDAARRYAKRLDKRWSLVDCASFLEMEKRGIAEALAHDRDFARAGFIPLIMSSGSTFKAITGRQLRETAFPIPPLDEQRRIIAILTERSAAAPKLQSAARDGLVEAMPSALLRRVIGDGVSEHVANS